ncbi:hypothetical protein HDK64DRAFT_314378, partial [Phyllosticta capitalensis]
ARSDASAVSVLCLLLALPSPVAFDSRNSSRFVSDGSATLRRRNCEQGPANCIIASTTTSGKIGPFCKGKFRDAGPDSWTRKSNSEADIIIGGGQGDTQAGSAMLAGCCHNNANPVPASD